MKMSLSAETSSLLVEQPCGLLHPDSTGDLKICNKSDHGPRLLPMISFVDSITVLQRQDWWRGKLLYKREKKTQNRGGRKSEEETEPGRKQRRNRDEKPEEEKPRNRGHTDEDMGKRTNSSKKKTKGYALDLFFGGSNFSSHCCYRLRRNEQKKNHRSIQQRQKQRRREVSFGQSTHLRHCLRHQAPAPGRH